LTKSYPITHKRHSTLIISPSPHPSEHSVGLLASYQHDHRPQIANDNLCHTLHLSISIIYFILSLLILIIRLLSRRGLAVLRVFELLVQVWQLRSDNMGHGRTMAFIPMPGRCTTNCQTRSSSHQGMRSAYRAGATAASSTTFDSGPTAAAHPDPPERAEGSVRGVFSW
jgi:hypothetical protein